MSSVHMAAAIPMDMDDDMLWASSLELFADPTTFLDESAMPTSATTSSYDPQLVMNKATIKINDIQVEGFVAADNEQNRMNMNVLDAEAMALEPIRMDEREPTQGTDPFEDALEVFMADDFLDHAELAAFECVDAMDIDMEDEEEDQAPMLQGLQQTLADLEREFFARATTQTNEQVDVSRTKRVRSLERVQRQWCGLALDNYKLRKHSTTFQQRANGLLQDLDGLLSCETTKQVILEALHGTDGQQAIAQARSELHRQFQEAPNAEANAVSWTLTQATDAAECVVLKADKLVTRQNVQATELAARTWTQFTQPKATLELTTHFVRPTRMQVLEQLGADEFVVLYDLVEEEEGNEDDVHVYRSVHFVTRKVDAETNAIGVGSCVLPASLWIDKLPVLSLLQYREHGGLWLTFTENAEHDTVVIGVRKALDNTGYSPEQVRTRHVNMLQRTMQAEALVLLPTTWL